jgi:hypothetical protein
VQVVVSTLAVISGIAAMDWHLWHGMDGKASIAAVMKEIFPRVLSIHNVHFAIHIEKHAAL